MLITRRSFFSFIAAPAVIRVADIMPVRTPKLVVPSEIVWTTSSLNFSNGHFVLYDESDSELIAAWDYGNAFTVEDGESFTLDFGREFVTLS